ncbi:DUF1304 family protein [Fructobacillus sp. M2-14]|uniref:DUF1304 family protein n=1 Tax=Fructobacillus broussonetiae TaxID=2713173 RepID=A0ABS5QZL0_9LACO|nr:DUF1304 family protein [Fructobacillus broussonetiae]MBS9338638.1 DUF1304 family protein [Fructobacillus broussonetiae]
MSELTTVLNVLVAIEFFYIFYRETIEPKSEKTATLFSLSKEDVQVEKVQLLLKNQGVYNALIGFGMLYGLLFQKSLVTPILIYIVLVALYGGYSSGKASLFFKQAGLAVMALLLGMI